MHRMATRRETADNGTTEFVLTGSDMTGRSRTSSLAAATDGSSWRLGAPTDALQHGDGKPGRENSLARQTGGTRYRRLACASRSGGDLASTGLRSGMARTPRSR